MPYSMLGGSFNGRTTGSGPVNGGSNPLPPAMVPSSSGLGYRPLTPTTRVRVPLGLPYTRQDSDKTDTFPGNTHKKS